MVKIQKLGLIAGSGQFPFIVMREAIKREVPVVVAAIREESSPEIEDFNSAGGVEVHWLGLGQLGKLIRLFRTAGVDKALMAGRVKHSRIFYPKGTASSRGRIALPDARMLRLLVSLPKKNTASLIGGVIKALEEEGMAFLDSTLFLKSLLPETGVLTSRQPDDEELRDIQYGRPVAREIAALDLGQTIVVKDQAVVAVEAMEGTDETILRAARLAKGQRLTVIKVSRPNQDMRFDVPVIGLKTLEVLKQCNVSAFAIDAGRTLMLDRAELIREADSSQITIVAD